MNIFSESGYFGIFVLRLFFSQTLPASGSLSKRSSSRLMSDRVKERRRVVRRLDFFVVLERVELVVFEVLLLVDWKENFRRNEPLEDDMLGRLLELMGS